jgi:hypothetical protein
LEDDRINLGRDIMKLGTAHVKGQLPEALEKQLQEEMQMFKMIFSGNKQHAKELLEIISKASNDAVRFPLRDKIHEISSAQDPEKTNPLLGAAGGLACTLVYNPDYYDIIQSKIENLSAEMTGEVEE